MKEMGEGLENDVYGRRKNVETLLGVLHMFLILPFAIRLKVRAPAPKHSTVELEFSEQNNSENDALCQCSTAPSIACMSFRFWAHIRHTDLSFISLFAMCDVCVFAFDA